jgi:putative glutamine amidotransferase
MFNNLGFTVVDSIYAAQVLCFTGGADVSPSLYGEDKHPRTSVNAIRDEEEVAIYKFALNRRIPMVGICRGAQFLHIMNGGSLYQDVDNHAIYGTHEAIDILTQEVVDVTSTHHQMMRNAGEGEVVCTANLSTRKEYMSDNGVKKDNNFKEDLEVVWHKSTRCLCFQPHPELEGADSTYLYFKNLLERYLDV